MSPPDLMHSCLLTPNSEYILRHFWSLENCFLFPEGPLQHSMSWPQWSYMGYHMWPLTHSSVYWLHHGSLIELVQIVSFWPNSTVSCKRFCLLHIHHTMYYVYVIQLVGPSSLYLTSMFIPYHLLLWQLPLDIFIRQELMAAD